MTTNEFSKSVNIGLKLTQRIYYGKHGPPTQPPKPPSMSKCPTLQSQLSSTSSFRIMPDKHHPTAPMVYAMISEPDIVDNPDIRSYQPHVYGRCNPPALIPLHMHEVSMNVDCCLDTAFVMVTGVWRVHCVTASKCCDCRVTIPMGEQGLLLDVDVETAKRSYITKLVMAPNDEKDSDRVAKAKDGFMMKHNTYTLKIPHVYDKRVKNVDGGSIIHVKARWSQKLLYQDDEFCLNVPFTFPSYVLPLDKTTPKIEKVSLNVNSGTETMITCRFASHPFKEVQQQAGEASFLYEAEVMKWSTHDFYFAYSVYRKEMIFLLDISGSMRDTPLEQSKYAITASLSKLNHGDSFNIIAFNEDIQSFSSSLELREVQTLCAH
ncbi:uncharacterized protein LOC143529225 [Bidens hawaiensis]|uniref:uncharacterized protein LOC143529225 n=1 Tax=Bidens hawaiensis TaxID=980011 RepID=UPI0040490A38